MADTEKTVAQLQALLANNASGAISPQDLRQLLASSMGGYASLLLTIAGAGATKGLTSTDSAITEYNVAGPTSATTFSGGCSASATTGIITIGQTGIYQVGFFLSGSVDVNNKIVHFTPYIDGVIGLVEVQRKFGTSGDIGSVSMNSIVSYSAGDEIDMRVRDETGTTTLTIQAMSLWVNRVG